MSESVSMGSEEKSKKKPGRACDHIRQALKRCLRVSVYLICLQAKMVEREIESLIWTIIFLCNLGNAF